MPPKGAASTRPTKRQSGRQSGASPRQRNSQLRAAGDPSAQASQLAALQRCASKSRPGRVKLRVLLNR